MKKLLILSAFILMACSSSPPPAKPLPKGHEVEPPIGLIQYCKDHPSDTLCVGK